ncbi:MAG: L,D-transpeptidase [Anaerolineales bacterium]
MKPLLSRRDFLRVSLLSLGSLAFRQRPDLFTQFPPEEQIRTPIAIGRVAADYVNIYKSASFKGEQLGRYERDTLVPILNCVQAALGWKNRNSHWYHTPEGFVHSAYIQRIKTQFNQPASKLPQGGQLGEITVAFSQGLRYQQYEGWQNFYRVYYQTVHWITGIIEGPPKGQHGAQPWYEITDERLRVRYAVPASHVRLISPGEIAPLSPEVPADEKLIQISIESQNLTAFEGDTVVFQTSISSGIHTEGPTANGIPTDTPLGSFYIGNKMPSRHMGDGTTSNDIYAYELPGVPWNMFFVSTGVALHGAYWHDNFGYRMSAGCINLRPEDAKWLYRWTTPIVETGEWHHYERGTHIIVQN